MNIFLAVCTIALCTSSPSADACPSGTVAMASFKYKGEAVVACEDLSTGNGTITVIAIAKPKSELFPVILHKRVLPNQGVGGDGLNYLNYTKEEVLAAPTDVLGNMLLGIHGFAPRDEPTWDEVAGIIPPLRNINLNYGTGTARVWVANRESGRDITFDDQMYNHMSGTPSPLQASKFLTGIGDTHFNAEGTMVGMPALVLNFPLNQSSNATLWEMVVVPVPEGTGFVQPVMIRFMQVNASSAAGQTAPQTLYVDSMVYSPSNCPHGSAESDMFAGCSPPAHFFTALLDNHFFWQKTWEAEGRMRLDLPALGGTDGGMLAEQSQHALILDMIVRSGRVWPRYGTQPGYDQPDDGQEEIFTATMMASLEWGLFEYAGDVLDNYFSYFIRHDGTVLYRGMEMAQQGRILTCAAQHYFYTRNSTLLLKHLAKVNGVAALLRERRDEALALYPETTDSRHGMPTGLDETDMWWASGASNKTSVPFISIAAEMWRGFRDAGNALDAIVAAEGAGLPAALLSQIKNVSHAMLSVVDPLATDIQRSMAKDATANANVTGGPRCFPYVAGTHVCGMLNGSEVGTSRASEAWRTYSEMLYSGLLEPATTAELLAWHQTQQGDNVTGSRLKLGVLAGAGNTVANGDQYEMFTIHGFGYGLLAADIIEPYILAYFAISSHAYTRGTWIAPESVPIDTTQGSPPFCAPAGLVAPLYLKWMLVFEEPANHTLWLGKATPRPWLQAGAKVGVANATTAYGRISFTYVASGGGGVRGSDVGGHGGGGGGGGGGVGARASAGIKEGRNEGRVAAAAEVEIGSAAAAAAGPKEVHVKIDWAWRAGGPLPEGGLMVRLRLPRGKTLASATLSDGRRWAGIDHAAEALVFTAKELAVAGFVELLSSITVHTA